MTTPPRAILLLLMLVLPAPLVFSQVSVSVVSVTPDEATSGENVTLRATLRLTEGIERAALLYRTFGQSQYERAEMDVTGNTASAVIPGRVVIPPFVEYYIVLVRRDGLLETYPVSERADPFTTPPENTLRLRVRMEEEAPQVLFLSPDPADVLAASEVLIAISLLRADSTVAPNATRILLDGVDLTGSAVVAGDLIVLSPENAGVELTPGPHQVVVRLFDRDGGLHRSSTLTFTVRGEGRYAYPEPVAVDWRTSAALQIESRHELIGTVGTWYNRASLSFTARKDIWRVNSNLYLTSEERTNRQPQNRFFAGVDAPWFSAGLGDAYPAFPNLILSGKRVRGLNASLRLDFFNVDLAMGEITRPVEGALLYTFPADSITSVQNANPSGAYAPIDSLTWGAYSYGTYDRQLLAVRPSFGSGETFQLGFTWLSARDDMSSIRFGTRPQENIVAGTDLVLRLDGGRTQLTAQGAFSAYNGDISSGTFTDEFIDTSGMFSSNREAVKKAKDVLSPFITVNDNLRPLTFPTQSTLAYEAQLALNYLDNALRVGYLFRGSDFTSFGQTYIRRDVKGFNILDRIRLAGNRLLLTAGYERLSDNTMNQKVATTVFTTVNAAVNYFIGPDLPNVAVGYTLYDNDNGLETDGADSLLVIRDKTNRFYLQTGYEFDLWARQAMALMLSTSRRKDESLRRADTRNISASLSVTTRYAFPLQTILDVSLNYNELPSTPGMESRLDYTTVTLFGRYALLTDVLSAFATLAPSFGDLDRTVIDLGLEWYLERTMVLTGQYSYFRNAGVPNDNFISLRLRYDI